MTTRLEPDRARSGRNSDGSPSVATRRRGVLCRQPGIGTPVLRRAGSATAAGTRRRRPALASQALALAQMRAPQSRFVARPLGTRRERLARHSADARLARGSGSLPSRRPDDCTSSFALVCSAVAGALAPVRKAVARGVGDASVHDPRPGGSFHDGESGGSIAAISPRAGSGSGSWERAIVISQ